ncbi:MAG: T9SS type A sorting domain-containing protein, partial [Bacteroidales bacterium]|nr:T9SS type A sorting domain-containing protein [Bacteroidales bacterium]
QFGCDSVITIQLTVIVIDNTVSYSSPVLSANHIGGSYQWINCSSMMPITGATSASFTATANGYYAVIITDNICVDTSACFPVSDLSLREMPENFVSLFPNPSKNEFTILFSEIQSDILLDIFSSDGKIVYSKQISNTSKYRINHNFAPGLYRIVIRNSSNKMVQKNLIIQ